MEALERQRLACTVADLKAWAEPLAERGLIQATQLLEVLVYLVKVDEDLEWTRQKLAECRVIRDQEVKHLTGERDYYKSLYNQQIQYGTR